MFVKPIAGRRVRCPVRGELLPESGLDVPDNAFWHARLKDGDVCLAIPSPQKTKEQK
ncbi:MAG TPA: DUF2635 domain-containing protein [Arsenophonus nasoniae]|uniref:DUF2635 domain-containing protein n=1 Tax=Arsenophonus nasoniae TaxID=638 RepID=UPI003879DD2B